MWKQVLWSDELRYVICHSDGCVQTWWLLGERYLPECVVPIVKFGGASVMVRCGISWFGLGPLVLVNGSMNSEVYANILENSMLPTLWQQFGIGPFLYQYDNAPVHKTKVIALWFEDNQTDVMNLAAQNLDLNSIRHLWGELERRLRARSIQPKATQELFTMLQE